MKLKYIISSFIEAFWKDFKVFWDDLGKPSKLLNILFYVMLILYFTERYNAMKYTMIIWIIFYVWKLAVDSGDYKKKYREDYKKKLKEKYN